MEEFVVPDEPQALWAVDSEHPGLRCEGFEDLAETDAGALADLAESERSCHAGFNCDSR